MHRTSRKVDLGFIALVTIIALHFPASVQAQDEEQQVLNVVREFFAAIGNSDSVGFNKVFMPNAHQYVARSVKDSTVFVSRVAAGRSIFKAGTTYRETMREKGVKVEVHESVAMAWVPYNFYVNNTFSHCGVDVFTFMKTREGWKIALIAYTVEKEKCKDW